MVFSFYLITFCQKHIYFCVEVEEAYENILTVSWRPSLAFSTAFCRDSFRCFAWEFLEVKSFTLDV